MTSMRAMRQLALAVSMVAGLASGTAQATEGVRVITAIGVCPSFCSDYQFSSDGGYGATSAITDLTASGGTAAATVALNGGFLTPLMRASSEGYDSQSRVDAEAFALYRYTYNGPNVVLSLSAQLTGFTTFNGSAGGAVLARISVFDGAPLLAPGATDALWLSPATYEAELGIHPVAEFSFYENSLTSGVPFSANDSLTLSLTNGSTFFLRTELSAVVRGATIADASSTLRLAFSDTTGLTLAPIPEPSTWLMLLAGGGVLALATRRRQMV